VVLESVTQNVLKKRCFYPWLVCADSWGSQSALHTLPILPSFSKIFIFSYIIVVLEVHFDIDKSAYNISSLNSLPPSFSSIHPPATHNNSTFCEGTWQFEITHKEEFYTNTENQSFLLFYLVHLFNFLSTLNGSSCPSKELILKHVSSNSCHRSFSILCSSVTKRNYLFSDVAGCCQKL
jgi:hypothetical protein